MTAATEPAPTWWAHNCACAWTAAWLTLRGRDWRGPREVLADPRLRGKLEWETAMGWRRSGHRPDLAVHTPPGIVVIEVELQRKADKRLRAVLSLYGSWIAEGRVTGAMYVCVDRAGAERVTRLGQEAGLSGRFRAELLSDLHEQAKRGGT